MKEAAVVSVEGRQVGEVLCLSFLQKRHLTFHVPDPFSDMDGRSPQVRQDNSDTEKMAIC